MDLKQKVSTFDSECMKPLVKLNKLCDEMMNDIRKEMKSFTISIEDKGQVFSDKIQQRVNFAPGGSHENFISRLVENIVFAAQKELPLKELRAMLAYEFSFSKSKRPLGSGSRYVTEYPSNSSCLIVSRTALCSVDRVIR